LNHLYKSHTSVLLWINSITIAASIATERLVLVIGEGARFDIKKWKAPLH
jgi:hypothetical protein